MKNWKNYKLGVKVAENLIYVIGGIISIFLFHKANDYANEQRLVESLGGEIFVAFVVYGIIYTLVKYASRKAIEYICSLEEMAANDPFKYESTVAVVNLLSNGSCKVRSRDGSVVCYSSLGEYLRNM
jgi:hypothetical protein